jgi:hypothetical protein
MNNNGREKLGRRATAEVVEGPWRRRLRTGNGMALVDAIVAGQDSLTKFELIERLIASQGMTPLEFAEDLLWVLENRGLRSKMYQRVDQDGRKRA